jgi:methionyl-tRNA synthetase
MKKNCYISTSIAYVNGAPHLGFALESIITDSLARFKRLNAIDTFFLTGTDEHGIKVYKTAQENEITAAELCEKNSQKFQELTQALNISHNDFIRTSDSKKHWPSAKVIWNRLEQSGDIYKKAYEGIYCEGCETFMQNKDLIEGLCPHHKKAPLKISEENYFFRLSKYSDTILDLIESKKIEIVPDFRKNEIVTMLKDSGLKDVSFSRPKENLPWGIPVPNDETQIMYVWCDALVNYISALDYANPDSVLYKKYWEQSERIHVIGKDIVRFHAGIWIGMLLSSNIPLPSKIIIHGFLTSEGEKMSKSLGNVIDPFLEIEKYGTDAVRYFLLSQIPLGQDYDFKREQFENIYNAHLANNLGNLVNRVHTLCIKDNIQAHMILDTQEINNKPNSLSFLFKEEIDQFWKDYNQHMKSYEIHKALETVYKVLCFANKQMDITKPWILSKNDPQALIEILPPFLEFLRHVALMLSPFMPTTSQNIYNVLGIKKQITAINSQWNAEKDNWNTLGEKMILFPRI